MSQIDVVRAQALEVAVGWSAPGSPGSWQLTAALFKSIAANDDLLAGLAGLPPAKLPALLASAAICLLVRRDQQDGLACYFPEPGGPQPDFDDGFFPAMHAYIAASMEPILAVCQSREYQMNEVARCSQVALGIAASIDQAAGEMALVDLGTGAGLGLLLDRYQYRIGGRVSGPAVTGVTLDCQVRGQLEPPPVRLPHIAERVGIDLAPVDLADPAAREWLAACTPPEESALARLTAAMDQASRAGCRVLGGDAVELLPEVLARLPAGMPALVVDTYMAVFLPQDRRELLMAVLARASRARPLTWLSLNPLVPLGPSGRDSVQGLAIPAALIDDYQQRGVFAVLGAVAFDGQSQHGRLLARAHPAGGWVEWLAAPPSSEPGLTGLSWLDSVLSRDSGRA